MSEVFVEVPHSSKGDAVAFPKLSDAELAALRPMAESCEFEDGDTIVPVGQPDIDLLVVESGGIEILNPSDDNRTIVIHGPGDFAGDIDMLTRRPIIVSMIAHGKHAAAARSRQAAPRNARRGCRGSARRCSPRSRSAGGCCKRRAYLV